MASGMKAPLDGSGAVGGSSCLCCDSRVRSVRDLQASPLCLHVWVWVGGRVGRWVGGWVGVGVVVWGG